ncbi:MAG: hypothetical protein R2751_19430 [Bacteroidales bacterium]
MWWQTFPATSPVHCLHHPAFHHRRPLYLPGPATGKTTFRKEALTVMAVDNLPGELPQDAQADFGEALMSHVIPELLGRRDTGMLERAGIAAGGSSPPRYAYLQDFLSGN